MRARGRPEGAGDGECAGRGRRARLHGGRRVGQPSRHRARARGAGQSGARRHARAHMAEERAARERARNVRARRRVRVLAGTTSHAWRCNSTRWRMAWRRPTVVCDPTNASWRTAIGRRRTPRSCDSRSANVVDDAPSRRTPRRTSPRVDRSPSTRLCGSIDSSTKSVANSCTRLVREGCAVGYGSCSSTANTGGPSWTDRGLSCSTFTARIQAICDTDFFEVVIPVKRNSRLPINSILYCSVITLVLQYPHGLKRAACRLCVNCTQLSLLGHVESQ